MHVSKALRSAAVLGLVVATTTAATAQICSGRYIIPAGIVFGTVDPTTVDGFGSTPDPTNYGYNGAGSAANGNKLDYFWVQDTSGPFNVPSTGTIWDLHGQANQVVVFPIIDHGPLPEEAWEYNVYLSDDKVTWMAADLICAWDEGWDPNLLHIADGYTTVWKLPGNATARYVSVTAGNDGTHGGSFFNSFDHEIDAVAGLTKGGNPVPEPGAMALLCGMALVGVRLMRRR